MASTLPAAGLAQQEAINQQILEQYMKNMQDLIAQQNPGTAGMNPTANPQGTNLAPIMSAPPSATQSVPQQRTQTQLSPQSTVGTSNGSMVSPSQQMPETLTNPAFTAGYLRTQIGKLMRVEFLIGNSITDRVGRLAEVGASFIILQSLETNTRYMCDLFSIKFVNIVDGMTPYPELAVL